MDKKEKVSSFGQKKIESGVKLSGQRKRQTNIFFNFGLKYDTGYPHNGRADNAAYRHDRRADKRRYPHDREIDIQMLKLFISGYILS